MDSLDFANFLPSMQMAAPGYTHKQKRIVKEQRKIEIESESESESEPEPEPEPAEINVIDDRSFIILNSTEECKWVRLTDGDPIDDQTPLPYFTRSTRSGKKYSFFDPALGRHFKKSFYQLGYFAGVLDEDTPALRREKACLYLTYLKSIFLKKWPTEAIKTFIKQQTAFKLATIVLWEKMRDGELPRMPGTFDFLLNGLQWFENRVPIELKRYLNSLDPKDLRKFLFTFDHDQRVQKLQNELQWPPLAALMFSYTIENMELPEIKNMFEGMPQDFNDSWDHEDLVDLSEVLQKIRAL